MFCVCICNAFKKGDDFIKRNYLIKLRKQNKLTQEQVSKKLKITTVFYGMIERGQRNPTLKLAKEIADLFNQSIEEIFF